MSDFSLECPNCSTSFEEHTFNETCDSVEKIYAWLKTRAGVTRYWCNDCGNGYDLTDDGVAAVDGGKVTLDLVT